MSENEIDEMFKILKDPESHIDDILRMAGVNQSEDITEDRLEQIYDQLMERLTQEENIEYIYSKGSQPGNEDALREIEPYIPRETRNKMQQMQEEKRILQIDTAKEAREFVLKNHSVPVAIKLAYKFWHNDEKAILELIKECGEINLVNVIDTPSEDFLFECIVMNKGYAQRQFIDLLTKNASNDILLKLLDDERIEVTNRNYILENWKIKIPEELANRLLSSGELNEEPIILNVENPSEEFLFNALSKNITNSEYISKLFNRYKIPDTVLYRCVFNHDIYSYPDFERKIILRQILGVDDESISIDDLLEQFANRQTTGELEKKENYY